MNILALDIANKTGWAVGETPGSMRAGTITLGTPAQIEQWGKTRLTRRNDPRFARLVHFINSFDGIDAIVFEDVQFVKNQIAGQLWASLRTAVWVTNCFSTGPLIEAVPVQTLKLFATGKGGASKERMCRALADQDSRFSAKGETVFDSETKEWLDDNATDAIWLWRWGQQYLRR